MHTTTARVLYALAAHHGHEWGIRPYIAPAPGEAWDVYCARVESAVDSVRRNGAIPGIARPWDMGEWHTTQTGRVAWRANLSGTVEVEIRRPRGACILIRVSRGRATWGWPDSGPRPEERHYEVLRGLLAALTGKTQPVVGLPATTQEVCDLR